MRTVLRAARRVGDLVSKPSAASVSQSAGQSVSLSATERCVALASRSPRINFATVDESLQKKNLVNRLLYRSKQRGFLEMDLLIGLWAEENVPRADAAMLTAFEEVLNEENPDLFKWLTGQAEAPEPVQQNIAFQALRSSVGSQLSSTVGEAARSQPGAEWVRGWDDWKKRAPTEDLKPS